MPVVVCGCFRVYWHERRHRGLARINQPKVEQCAAIDVVLLKEL
jgi:hypothetical protein